MLIRSTLKFLNPSFISHQPVSNQTCSKTRQPNRANNALAYLSFQVLIAEQNFPAVPKGFAQGLERGQRRFCLNTSRCEQRSVGRMRPAAQHGFDLGQCRVCGLVPSA